VATDRFGGDLFTRVTCVRDEEIKGKKKSKMLLFCTVLTNLCTYFHDI